MRNILRNMTMILALGVAIAGCNYEASLEITTPDGDFGGSMRRFEWRGSFFAGDELEIKGVVGSVYAAPAVGHEGEVVAILRGGRSNPAEVRIEVVEHARGVTICAVYPVVRHGCRRPRA